MASVTNGLAGSPDKPRSTACEFGAQQIWWHRDRPVPRIFGHQRMVSVYGPSPR